MRALENVLLLKPKHHEARLKLGVVLVSYFSHVTYSTDFTQRHRLQCLRGTHMIEDVFRAERTKEHADLYVSAAHQLAHRMKKRTAEMYEFVLANSSLYSERSLKQVRIKQGFFGMTEASKDPLVGKLHAAIGQVQENPNRARELFNEFLEKYRPKPEVRWSFAEQYLDVEHPMVRFFAHRTAARVLFWPENDPKSLQHYDIAIDAHEKAYQSIRSYPFYDSWIDRIYREKIGACEGFKKADEARPTQLRGAEFYMKQKRFSLTIAELWHDCAASIESKEPDKALQICNAFLHARGRYGQDHTPWNVDMVMMKDRLEAKSSGKVLPDFKTFKLIKESRFAKDGSTLVAGGGKVWFVAGRNAYMHVPGSQKAELLDGMPRGYARCVASTENSVFFGLTSRIRPKVSGGGVYEFGLDGKLRGAYLKEQARLPARYVADLCASEGKLNILLWDRGTSIIAQLDPTSRNISVLAPSDRNATKETEPVGSQVYRLWWHGIHSRLYANYHQPRDDRNLMYYYVLEPEGWRKITNRDRDRHRLFHFVVSQGGETLEMKDDGKQSVFDFAGKGEGIRCKFHFPGSVGMPAWDENRLWVPTFTGLYEVDRKSGSVKLLATEQGVKVYSVLRYQGTLYVATSEGLYASTIH